MANENEYGFERVASLNEAAKQLIARSFQVNLLALDAMVQSKRGGALLRGFDEVSSQMRSWSRDLHGQLLSLGKLSTEVVSLTSSTSKDARQLQLLERAAVLSRNALAREVHDTCSADHAEREAQLRRSWRRVMDALSDLDQLGMMAVVLSRSAMIEASSGSSALRAQLGQVSEEFYRNSEAVASVLKSLLKSMKGA